MSTDNSKTQTDAENQAAAMDARVKAEELESLRESAKTLGITFSGNTGADTLREKIAAKLAEKPEQPADPVPVVVSAPAREETELEKTQRIRQEVQAEGMRLIRIRVSNMNPAKADLHGEIISTQNKYLGTVRKYVPFGEGSDEGYHVPHCLLQVMQERQFNQVKTRKGRNTGEIIVEERMVREFNIEILPPLTPEELKRLAAMQAAKSGID